MKKKDIVKMLIEAGHIDFDEALILMETEKEYVYPYHQPYWYGTTFNHCVNGEKLGNGFYSDAGSFVDSNGNCIINN